MFNELIKADMRFTKNEEEFEIVVDGYKPLLKAGIFNVISKLAESDEMSFEDYCHQLIELNKKVSLKLAVDHIEAPDEVFGVALDEIMDAEIESDPMLSLLKKLGAKHDHDCANCNSYDICDLSFKKPLDK